MKKSELEALGLDATTIKAVQVIHGKDMQALQAKTAVKAPNEDARAAIAAMLPMIRKKEHLAELLMKCTYLYHAENRRERPQEPPKSNERKIAPVDFFIPGEVTQDPETPEGGGEEAQGDV